MMSGDTSKQGSRGEPLSSGDSPADESKSTVDSTDALSRAKHNADVGRQTAKLRKLGMRHRAKASTFLVKVKKSEEKAATLLHKANQLKQESMVILDQAKNKGKSASELRKKLDTVDTDSQGSDAGVQMSRLEHEEAVLTRQANQMQARAAALNDKATSVKRRSIYYMQRQRSHEVESEHYLKRAEDLERRSS